MYLSQNPLKGRIETVPLTLGNHGVMNRIWTYGFLHRWHIYRNIISHVNISIVMLSASVLLSFTSLSLKSLYFASTKALNVEENSLVKVMMLNPSYCSFAEQTFHKFGTLEPQCIGLIPECTSRSEQVSMIQLCSGLVLYTHLRDAILGRTPAHLKAVIHSPDLVWDTHNKSFLTAVLPSSHSQSPA